VFGGALRARTNHATQSPTTMVFPNPVEAAQLAAAAAFWILVLGALFGAWLISANPARMEALKRELASECVSFGRGGARCPERPANDNGASNQIGAAGDCAALGKGGRVCFGRAAMDREPTDGGSSYAR